MFDFVPHIFALFSANGEIAYINSTADLQQPWLLDMNGVTTSYVAYYSANVTNYSGVDTGVDNQVMIKKSSDGLTLYWYAVRYTVDSYGATSKANSASMQQNVSSTTYRWVAIG